MTRDETKRIVMIIVSTYPNFKPLDMSFTVDAWSTMLSDYSYNEIALALKAYVTTSSSGFAPDPGQIIDKIYMVEDFNQLNEMEAWALVSKALRNGYYGAEEEYEKLPPIVQKAVGTVSNLRNWSQTDTESVENVIQSNFMRAYRTEIKRAHEAKRIPEEVRNLINATKNKMIGEEK